MGCRSLSDLDGTPRRGCRQSYAAKRCSPLLAGPPATRGSTFPLRAAPNHSIRQRSARHLDPTVAGRPRSASPGVFKNSPSSYEHEWAPDLVRRIRNSRIPSNWPMTTAPSGHHVIFKTPHRGGPSRQGWGSVWRRAAVGHRPCYPSASVRFQSSPKRGVLMHFTLTASFATDGGRSVQSRVPRRQDWP
jgi:hypothetical protein